MRLDPVSFTISNKIPEINDEFILELQNEFEDISLSKTYSGEGIIISNGNAKGVILKGINKSEKNSLKFFKSFLYEGSLDNFKLNTESITKMIKEKL